MLQLYSLLLLFQLCYVESLPRPFNHILGRIYNFVVTFIIKNMFILTVQSQIKLSYPLAQA